MKSGERWSVEKFSAVASSQRSSGLSVQAYCRREGINVSSFYRWRDRVASSRRVARRTAEAVGERSEVGEFIALTALPMSSRLELRFDLGGGLSLTVLR
jgi:ribulose 1,5-bisphosphate carboxylase large subunit-like protein